MIKLKVLAVLAFAIAFPKTGSAIEVAFEKDARVPLVYLNVAVKAGTVTDPEGKSGITNFMGEMLLRGTKARTKEQIDLELDQMGARLAVETRAEALILRGAVVKSQLKPFLDLLTDIATQPSFPEREIVKLKSEIVSGILEELGRDSSLASRHFNAFLFEGHPYGKSVLGNTKEVQGLTRDELSAHYDRLFRDSQLLVVGAGDAEFGVINTWATELAKVRPGGTAVSKAAPPKPSTKRRLLIIDKPDRTQTTAVGGQIGLRMTDPDFFPLYLGNHAFGGGSFSARMMVEIRVKRGWSYGAYSYFRHGLRPRSWQFSNQSQTAATADALALLVKMTEEVKAKGITKEEFAFAQESLVNSAGFMFDTPTERVDLKLLERTIDLPDGFMKNFGPELKKVKLEQVNAAFQRFLKPETLSFTVVATAKDMKAPLAKAAGVPESEVQVVPYTQQ